MISSALNSVVCKPRLETIFSMSAKAGLKGNKAVFVSIGKGGIDKNEIKRHLRTVEKCINQLCRDMAFAEERHKVELLLLKRKDIWMQLICLLKQLVCYLINQSIYFLIIVIGLLHFVN